MNFDSFRFHPLVAAGVRDNRYETPTPIQNEAIPPILAGRDVMGIAQTGTGKTAAFALPILQRLAAAPARHIRALVIAPTRELAEQINEAVKSLGAHVRVRTATVYGGVSDRPQIEKLRRGVDVVVACPGRLLDHIERRNIDLSRLEVLVLDEADHMFDMGFIPTIRRILGTLPKKRQTLMFSATMPQEIRGLAEAVLHDPVRVAVRASAPAETVAHALYPVASDRKTDLLVALVRGLDSESMVIFARTKRRAKKLCETLQKSGFDASCLQGNMSQNKRKESLDGFRDGTYRILVATDIASRGIDVSGITHVINYDMPDTVDAYTHRIGRTGRAAKTGDAFTLVEGEDREMVRAIEKILGRPIERRKLEGFDDRAAPRDVERTREPARGPARAPAHGGRHSDGHRRPQAAPGSAPAHRSHPAPSKPSRGRPAPRPSGRDRDDRRAPAAPHAPHASHGPAGAHTTHPSHAPHAPRGSHPSHGASGAHAPRPAHPGGRAHETRARPHGGPGRAPRRRR